MSKKATAADAQLIMQLYDLRREAEMRKARNWWVDRILAAERRRFHENCWSHGHAGKQLAAPGRRILEHGGVVRAARSVERGVVSPAAVSGEMFIVFAKVHPFLKELREKIGRPADVRQHRESHHGFQVRPGTVQVHAEASAKRCARRGLRRRRASETCQAAARFELRSTDSEQLSHRDLTVISRSHLRTEHTIICYPSRLCG